MHRFLQSRPSALIRSVQSTSNLLPTLVKVLALAVIVAAFISPSMAATNCTTVSTLDDSSSPSTTPGTLRYAIRQADGLIGTACDTITFSVTGTITLGDGQGQLEIQNTGTPITITGPGAASLAISGNVSAPSRVFQIDNDATATISGVTIEYGNPPGQPGGGVYLSASATLTLSNSTLSNNSSVDGGAIYIDSGGTLTVSGSTLSGNSATGGADGGAIYINTGGTVTVNSNSTISGNSAGFGGGIADFGTLTVSNSTISGNSVADGFGGGILQAGGTLTVNNSTISGNSTSGSQPLGGGIFAFASTVTLSNSTISGNSALGGSGLGGGIINYQGTTMTVINSTVSGNSADFGGGIYNGGPLTLSFSTFSGNSATIFGGALYNDNSTLTMKSNILANSTGGNCYDTGGGSVTSNGYNISDDGNTNCTFLGATGDLSNTDPGLDSNGLQDNGGPTKTIKLISGSNAIDKVPINSTTGFCTDGSGTTGNNVTNDQRGTARPQPTGGLCDIGAFEVVGTTPFFTFTPKLNISTGATAPVGFSLNIAFTLSATDSPIFPLTKPVTLTVGSYTATVPASSFKLLTNGAKKGSYVFSGTVNGATLSEQLSPTATGYSFMASETGVKPATSGAVSVTLTIGTDSSTASVTPRYQ